MRSPGGEDGDSGVSNGSDGNSEIEESVSDIKEEGAEKKTLTEKIHEALQDWSNDDQRDQEFDDTRP